MDEAEFRYGSESECCDRFVSNVLESLFLNKISPLKAYCLFLKAVLKSSSTFGMK